IAFAREPPMKVALLRNFHAATLALAAALALHAASSPADDARITHLISRLDSGSFQERQRAELALEEIGEPALPALGQVLTEEPNVELRRRAEKLVGTIEKRGRVRSLATRLLQQDAEQQTAVLNDLETLRDLKELTAEVEQQAKREDEPRRVQ